MQHVLPGVPDTLAHVTDQVTDPGWHSASWDAQSKGFLWPEGKAAARGLSRGGRSGQAPLGGQQRRSEAESWSAFRFCLRCSWCECCCSHQLKTSYGKDYDQHSGFLQIAEALLVVTWREMTNERVDTNELWGVWLNIFSLVLFWTSKCFIMTFPPSFVKI